MVIRKGKIVVLWSYSKTKNSHWVLVKFYEPKYQYCVGKGKVLVKTYLSPNVFTYFSQMAIHKFVN